MVNNDMSILAVKHAVLEKVCRLAWEDGLTRQNLDRIPYEVSPGPKPVYRCCVYKEREVVRQRVKLALGENVEGHTGTANNVQVIKPACDGCPTEAYFVTNNCRFCLGKVCQNTCKFGAITPGEMWMRIDPNKCKNCGMCAKACPYHAIIHLERPCKVVCPVGAITYDEDGFCVINDEKCIHCGQCIHSCPFGAIGTKITATRIIREIKSGKKVIAMCAPSIEGQFGEGVSLAAIRRTLKQVGFADMVEVGLGGDMTAAYESKEWSEARAEGRKMTTSCCSAFINMLKNNFPEQFKNNMSSVVSPMCAISRYLKALDPETITVFVGPCIAKKSEIEDPELPGNADHVLTYGEINALVRSKGLEFTPETPEDEAYQESSLFGKKFASSGGVADAVLECMKERGEDTEGIKLLKCAGGEECRKALMLLKAGKLPEDFIEGMMCHDGCVGGPSRHQSETEIAKARQNLLAKADGRKILENLEQYPMDKFSMFRNRTEE